LTHWVLARELTDRELARWVETWLDTLVLADRELTDRELAQRVEAWLDTLVLADRELAQRVEAWLDTLVLADRELTDRELARWVETWLDTLVREPRSRVGQAMDRQPYLVKSINTLIDPVIEELKLSNLNFCCFHVSTSYVYIFIHFSCYTPDD
jgi:hypothetical protein